MSHDRSNRNRALQDFQMARRQAALQDVMSLVTGKSNKLMAFDEVRQNLKATDSFKRGIQEIPLDAIVGSCDRYEDFTRTFLPLRESDKERWARVNAYVAEKGIGNIAPILVYQIGQVYFVLDGNHRVSVAQQLGATHIRADVTELETKASLSPEDEPDQLILKAELVDFLERSHLDETRPQTDLKVTAPGKYWILEAQIEAHRYLVTNPTKARATFQEAAVYWHDGVYQGVVQVIRDRGLLQDFPNRTETDLYLWIFEHRAGLKQQLGWDLGAGSVLTDLTVQQRGKRAGRRAIKAVTPKQLAVGPEAGQWRREKSLSPDHSRLFFNLLVAVTGETKGWQALEQGIEIATRERGRIRGLHLVSAEADKDSSPAKAMQAEFKQRCQLANIPGELTIESGPAVDKICERAWLADLVIAPLLNPPGSQMVTRLSSEFRALIQRCARPVLAVPNSSSHFNRALLPYDGSQKAKEALFVATYIAERWKVPLVVLAVAEKNINAQIAVAEAEAYLKNHGVNAKFVQKDGPAGEAILEASEAYTTDVIVMGGYGHSPVRGLVLGSSVDAVLQHSDCPILICR